MTYDSTAQVRVHGPGRVQLDTVRLESVGERDVLVDVKACGVCGTDLRYIRLGGLAGPGSEPMALGHEISGLVAKVGSQVKDVSVGDRVVVHPGDNALGRIGNGSVHGGLTQSLLVREAAGGGRLYPIPAGMSMEVAALAEPLAVGMHAVAQADATATDKVAVFGCGPIGLAAIAALADLGATDIVGIDLSATRRRLATQLGAHATIDPVAENVWAELAAIHGSVPATFGTPATSAFIEASGVDSVITDIVNNACHGARISVVALHPEPIPVNFLLVLIKELAFRGSMEYPEGFDAALDLLSRKDLTAMITHRFPLDQINVAIETLATSKECGKVMIATGDPVDNADSLGLS